ncbi:MAG: hypothetical protein IM638_19930 [Bacteroidetes bacterium]|nr:hypothetical protein [Bacteroidota bacterium]
MKKNLLSAFMCLSVAAIHAQNLEKIGQKDMVTISGGLNFSSVLYDAQGFEARRDPFTWFFSGNLNVTILDVSLPFTYSYSNQRGTFTQPFNMQAVHPKWKWIQGHAGTTAMNFSNYTLAGHVFTGGGVELTPAGWYAGAMYGRLRKAIAFDPAMTSTDQMSFRRMGWGVKAGFDKDGHAIGITYFTAKDEENSLLFLPPGAAIAPMQNTALSISGKTKLSTWLSVSAELAVSGLTRNTNAETETTDFNGWQKWLLPTRTTTQFFRAWNAAITFTQKNFSVALKHEHVDPDYQTLGAYFFNNDLENYTVAPSFKLWKGKLNIGLNTGFQRNNLDKTRQSTTQRWVGSVNVSAMPGKNWTLNASYSNFTAFTNQRPQADPFWVPTAADTLNFYQLSQQASALVSKSFGEKSKWKKNVAVNAMYQVTGQQQSGSVLPSTTIINGNVSFGVQHAPSKTTVSLVANGNQSSTPFSILTPLGEVSGTIVTQQYGPGLNVSRSFAGGTVRVAAGSSYNRAVTAGVLTGNVISSRAQISWSPKTGTQKQGASKSVKAKLGKPSLQFSPIFVQRLPASTAMRKTSELTATVNLNYTF